MEQPALPLNYYCRSARLCLKKADFSRKAGMQAEELQHLRKFETLVLTTIPSHPNYHLHRGEAGITELQIMLVGVEKRIREFETEFHPPKASSSKTPRSSSSKLSVKSKSLRIPAEQPAKKTKKSLRKATKKRPAWDLGESLACKSCGRSSPSVARRTSASDGRRSTSGSLSPRRKISPPAQKFLEGMCATCRDNDTVSSWRFGSPEKAGTDRELLTRRPTILVSRRAQESSISPISRAFAPLEEDYVNMQSLVLELKGSFDAFKVRFDEEGRLWRGRTEGLEKEVKYWRHDMEIDLNVIRKSIQDEVKKNMEVFTKDLAAAEDLWASNEVQKKERLDRAMNRSSAEMEEYKEKINFSFLEAKALLMKTVDEKIASCMGGMKAGLKSDFEIFELGISRDVQELRREMAAKCESFLRELELVGMGGKQRIECITKDAVEKLLPQKLDSLVGKEKTLADMKEALCLLWKEVESLTRHRRGTEKEQARPDDRESLRRSHDSADDNRLKASSEFRRGLLKQTVERIMPQQEKEATSELNEQSINDVREELRALWSEVELLSKGRKEIREAGENEDRGYLKKQLQFVRKEAMQARVDVEDVRKDCNSMRRTVDDLEDRLCHLQEVPNVMPDVLNAGLSDIEETKTKMEVALSVIEKEKEVAVMAAADAAEAASRAARLVEQRMEEVLGCEKLNALTKSFEFQKSLALEKDMIAESAGAVLTEVKKKSLHLQESLEQDISKVKDSFATEVRKMSIDLSQEKACAAAAASEVLVFQKNLKDAFAKLEKERDAASSEVLSTTQEFQKSLKDTFVKLEKERDAASSAASEITSLAERAEELLMKMAKCKTDKSLGLKEAILRVETELDFQGREEQFARNLTILEARVKEASAEHLVMKERLTETSKKLRKVETTQSTIIRSLDEVRAGTTGLEKSAAVLMPQLEEAASTLKDVENRISMLESPNVRKKKTGISPYQKALDGAAVALDTKIIMLEKRIDHVASASYTNLRILDGKVEKLTLGVQTALDGMTTTESKCSSLGEEVVRVFRMLLAARGSKTRDNNGAVFKKRTNTISLIDHPAARCVCCNSGNRWTSPRQQSHSKSCPAHADKNEVRKINLRLDSESCAIRSGSPLQCTIRSAQSPRQNQVMLLDAVDDQQNESTMTPSEDTVTKPAADNAETRHTNVRLESGGRIRVNLRHS